MITIKQKAHQLIDELPDSTIEDLMRFIEKLRGNQSVKPKTVLPLRDSWVEKFHENLDLNKELSEIRHGWVHRLDINEAEGKRETP